MYAKLAFDGIGSYSKGNSEGRLVKREPLSTQVFLDAFGVLEVNLQRCDRPMQKRLESQ